MGLSLSEWRSLEHVLPSSFDTFGLNHFRQFAPRVKNTRTGLEIGCFIVNWRVWCVQDVLNTSHIFSSFAINLGDIWDFSKKLFKSRQCWKNYIGLIYSGNRVGFEVLKLVQWPLIEKNYHIWGTKRHISAIYERFDARWSVQLALTKYEVKIGVTDITGNLIFPRKMDIGIRVCEQDHESTWYAADLIFFRFIRIITGESSKKF
jgi:hypothetical protein